MGIRASATCVLNDDGRLVVYSGDDDYFEYIYRFVSRDKVNLDDRAANHHLLDHGELSVARFEDDGKLRWIPLVYGQGKLTEDNGFASQADVLIGARHAGDVVGATKMDRPEGIAVHPESGEVYVSLTKNPKRKDPNRANPRTHNRAGHIIRMVPPGGVDHAAPLFDWSFFMLAGNPDDDAPRYAARPSTKGWLGCPDNLTFDPQGRLWIATDGMPEFYGTADGLYAATTRGDRAGVPKAFFRAPIGAEVTGPSFTPNGETLFLSIQHPGEGSRYANPSTRWPDFNPAMPPRPTVLAITRAGGGTIGD